MTLRDDIREALDPLVDEYVEWGNNLCLEAMTDAVWAVLEDKVGAVQEQLMTQLTMTRTELEATRARETTMREIIAAQAALLGEQEPAEVDGV